MTNTQPIVDKEKRTKLLRLQKEYLQKTIDKLDTIIELSQELENLNDPELISSYCEKIDSLDIEM